MLRILKVSPTSFICLSLLIVVAAAENKNCDKTQCAGPVRFYEDLECKPTFKKPGDCCAVKYDCSHLYGRSTNKCHVNGHEYEIGQDLKAQDKIEPCSSLCHCSSGNKNVATFACAIIDCFPKEAKPGCYLLRRNINTCCGAEEICPENQDNVLKCHANGKIYSDGERFIPNDDLTLVCQCMEGYKGKKVAPFCRKSSCSTELKRAYELKNKCAPIFEYNQLPANSCSGTFRCQNENDKVIENGHAQNKDKGQCEFGSLKLNIGDELNQSTIPISKCVSCTCDVPPTLTCRRLSYDECQKKYPQASN